MDDLAESPYILLSTTLYSLYAGYIDCPAGRIMVLLRPVGIFFLFLTRPVEWMDKAEACVFCVQARNLMLRQKERGSSLANIWPRKRGADNQASNFYSVLYRIDCDYSGNIYRWSSTARKSSWRSDNYCRRRRVYAVCDLNGRFCCQKAFRKLTFDSVQLPTFISTFKYPI